MKSRIVILAAACLALSAAAHAQPSTGPVKIGVLSDQSSAYSSGSGTGASTAVRMAVEEVGGTVLGRPIEVVLGDHQNKPDVGSAVARQWYTQDGVAAIVDVPNSAVALAVQEVAKQTGRIALLSGAISAELTGKSCNPFTVQWTVDTYALAAGTGAAVTQAGNKTWYLISVDYAFGVAMSQDLRAAVEANGGKVLGEVKHPLGTTDFSSYLLQAQSSGAKVVGLLSAGADSINAIKQAEEFGLLRNGTRLAGMVLETTDIHAIGLPTAQGLVFTGAFYWDLDDATRAWSKRFFEKQGRMPTGTQAGAYSATLHWLRAVKAAGTTESGAVMAAMRATPVEDMMTHGARIRADGRLVRDFYLFEVKRPAESNGPWDLQKVVRVIPAADAVRPAGQSACPLLNK